MSQDNFNSNFGGDSKWSAPVSQFSTQNQMNQGQFNTQSSNFNSSFSSVVEQDLSVHVNVRCDNCKTFPVTGRRYKCLQCNNFDYCEKCYLINKSVHSHVFNCITMQQEKVFSDVRCNGCQAVPIFRQRYKCNTCHDFDYCELCFKRNQGIHRHEFTLIK